MNHSHANSRSRVSAASPEKAALAFPANSHTSACHLAPEVVTNGLPGTLNDSVLVRTLVAESMRACTLSRAELADRMSYLTGTSVTERMLNNFSAESREDYRFPAELVRAFCVATGDFRLLTSRAELAGLHLVDETGRELMELGRQYLLEKRAAAKRHGLEVRLEGVAL